MKKIVFGFIALTALASPSLARNYQGMGNAAYAVSSDTAANASYAAAPDANVQRERDRAESYLSR